MEVHLDLVGGIAGDMFIAALLDAFPGHEPRVAEAIRASSGSRSVVCGLTPHRDAVLCGHRFDIRALGEPAPRGAPPPTSARSPASVHEHIAWRDIRARLGRSTALEPEARAHALGIFELLAQAEAQVHGIAEDEVEFHEVGAWDSVADIVGAAALIAALDVTRWSASPAPVGGGRVETAHGVLPLPAPATARLLKGLETLDDGVDGERVTPTGAAILRYLCPPDGTRRRAPGCGRILEASGTGFGSRRLPGISNHLRVLCFAPPQGVPPREREMHVLEFEVDDQSGEDLAVGLERIRADESVLDVTQAPVFGKKGRMMTHVQVLARHGRLEPVIERCFRETTTIGLRHRIVAGVGLARRSHTIALDGGGVRVKIVDRPGGRTAKAESDDVAAEAGQARRASLRRRAESAALGTSSAEADHA